MNKINFVNTQRVSEKKKRKKAMRFNFLFAG